MKHENYVRKGRVTRVVNGNTLDIEVDLGFNIKSTERIDLARLSPIEQFSDKGLKAKLKMSQDFHFVKDVTLQYDKHPENSSRYIAEVWMDNGDNITDILLALNCGVLDEGMKVNVLG